MIKKTFVLFFLIAVISNAQYLGGEEKIEFDSTRTGSSNTKTFFLVNKSNKNFIGQAKTSNSRIFTPSDTLINMAAGDSILLQIRFSPESNIRYTASLIIYNQDTSAVFAATLSGAGFYGDSYDATTYNKFDMSLKTALTNLVSNHTSLGYNTARDRMFETIDDYGGDTIECVYTGTKIYATTRTQAQNQGFDTEHTWPQGTFSQAEPMRSDLFHLYPTTTTSNNTRSNYPFGNVLSGITWTQGGSKLGKDKYNQTVFEPRDIHKGNVARSMLYFILRYNNNYQSYLDTVQENVYRQWNLFDTVESRERRRNNLIASYQGKRNPLIDHPDFVDRIYSFVSSTNRPAVLSAKVIPARVSFDTVNVNSTAASKIYFLNTGNTSIRIDSVSSGTLVRGNFNNSNVEGGGVCSISLGFSSGVAGAFAGNVSVYTSAGIFNVPFTAYASPSTGLEKINSGKYNFDLTVYPNPFREKTIIRYTIPDQEESEGKLNILSLPVTIKVYDILGGETALLLNEVRNPGEYEISFMPAPLRAGVYLIELKYAGTRVVKKAVYLK